MFTLDTEPKIPPFGVRGVEVIGVQFQALLLHP